MITTVNNLYYETKIHPTAIISPEVQIGERVQIGAYCIIEGPVVIGDDTILHHHVHLKGPTIVGRKNVLYSFASVGCDTQDKKYLGEESYLKIGDENIIREYVTISRGTAGGGHITKIGHHNLLMAYVHIAHDCEIGNYNIFANGASLAGHVRLNDHVGLGGFSGVHQFCKIGSYAFCAGGSIITKDVPPFTLVAGHPAKLCGLNSEGLKRRGFSDADRSDLKRIYRRLFRSSLSLHDEAQSILNEGDHPYRRLLANFILTSERGVIR